MANGIKTGGREAGTPNKITKELREVLQSVLENEIVDLPNTLAQLPPKDRLEVVIKLLQYVIPKLKETEIIGEDKNRFIINWVETKCYDSDEKATPNL